MCGGVCICVCSVCGLRVACACGGVCMRVCFVCGLRVACAYGVYMAYTDVCGLAFLMVVYPLQYILPLCVLAVFVATDFLEGLTTHTGAGATGENASTPGSSGAPAGRADR